MESRVKKDKNTITISTGLFIGKKSYQSLILALVFLAISAITSAKQLTVYTYQGFDSAWGPGPVIKEGMAQRYGIDVNFVSFEDANVILSRLKLEGKKSQADVVIGLDAISAVPESKLFLPHKIKKKPTLPVDFFNERLLPFDYGWIALVYDNRKISNPPKSLYAMVNNSKLTLQLEDPRTSSPGLAFMYGMKRVFREDYKKAWGTLKPRISKVSSSWTEAYSLFIRGESDMVVSYTTSPAYHQLIDKNEFYSYVKFSEGHVLQIECAAIVAGTKNLSAAKDFMEYITLEDFQKNIPQTQWMFPAFSDKVPKEFEAARVSKSLFFSEDELNFMDSWINEWLDAMSN